MNETLKLPYYLPEHVQQQDRRLPDFDPSNFKKIETADLIFPAQIGSFIGFNPEEDAMKSSTLADSDNRWNKGTRMLAIAVAGLLVLAAMLNLSEPKSKPVNPQTTTEATYAARAITVIPRPSATITPSRFPSIVNQP